MTNKNAKKLIEQSKKRENFYQNIINETMRNFRDLNSENMQAVLIQIEDFLDRNHIYAFRNWFEGILWDGPDIERYWIKFTLKYDYHEMPDPRAAERLIKLGCIIQFEESYHYVPKDNHQHPEDLDPITRKPKETKAKIWLVHFSVPLQLIQAETDKPLPAEDDIQDNSTNELSQELEGEESEGEEGEEEIEDENQEDEEATDIEI